MTVMSTHAELEMLQPRAVWAHFARLCAIPHPSYREAALRENIINWANERGIESSVDAAGNLILRKPGSPGCEASPSVVLQGHLDMVCQANAGTRHDFERDPIGTVVRDGWVEAKGTTLGADNGIGVALALAALEDPELVHPPLEVLFTVNEESGMDGARGLRPGTLQGRMLINLDTEEWGHFYLGCAGGVDVEVRNSYNAMVREGSPFDTVERKLSNYTTQEKVTPEHAVLRFDVSGLRGGHSGIDIHLGRGNAIKLLAEALRDLSAHTDVRLIEMKGGTARNAIPREAYALCLLPVAAAERIGDWVRHRHDAWRKRFAQEDDGVAFSCRRVDMELARTISHAEQEQLLAFLDVIVNGVVQGSIEFPGVTDTSTNLGVFALEQGELMATFKVRSLDDERADELADLLVSRAGSYGLGAWKDGAYPGWTPNPSSRLLTLCQEAYTERFGQPASLQVIHAGLECGLLAASHPHLDMISFGPDIRGAHAPGERVEIASVERCWELLKAVLHSLASVHEE